MLGPAPTHSAQLESQAVHFDSDTIPLEEKEALPYIPGPQLVTHFPLVSI